MIGKILAAMIGGAVDKSDGEGGTMGAIIGVAAESALRRLGPIGWVIGIVWALGALLLGRRRPKGRGSGRSARPQRTARRPSVRHLTR